MSASARGMNERVQRGWVPVETVLAEDRCRHVFCFDELSHWRVVSVRPRVRKAYVVIVWVGACPLGATRFAKQIAAAYRPDPDDWIAGEHMLPPTIAVGV